MLDSLTTAEMSAKYGKGFELLQRMGFKANACGGLRPDSLQAPLLAYNQGRSRRGVQVEEEDLPPSIAPYSGPVSKLPISDLLADVLRSMRDVGDDSEAEQLEQLANCVGFEGSLKAFGAPAEGTRKRKKKKARMAPEARVLMQASSSSSDSDGDSVDHAALASPLEREAAAIVLKEMIDDQTFPVELDGQAEHLRWKGRWARELGAYEDFVERRSDLFRLVRCPWPHGALVLPLHVPGERSPCTNSAVWAGGEKYAAWVHDKRLAATGKGKRKWKHLEKIVSRLCRGMVLLASAAAEYPDALGDLAGAAVAAGVAQDALNSDAAVAAEEHEEAEADEAEADDDTADLELGWCEDTLGA